MLRVSEVNVGDYINYSAVSFLREALILAAVSGFHMEDGNMKSFCRNSRKAGVGISEDEKGLGCD